MIATLGLFPKILSTVSSKLVRLQPSVQLRNLSPMAFMVPSFASCKYLVSNNVFNAIIVRRDSLPRKYALVQLLLSTLADNLDYLQNSINRAIIQTKLTRHQVRAINPIEW